MLSVFLSRNKPPVASIGVTLLIDLELRLHLQGQQIKKQGCFFYPYVLGKTASR